MGDEVKIVEKNNILKLVPPIDTRKKKPHYTVGTNDFGDTVLTMHGDYGGQMSLTMNPAATVQLIKMLEASLPDVDEDDDA